MQQTRLKIHPTMSQPLYDVIKSQMLQILWYFNVFSLPWLKLWFCGHEIFQVWFFALILRKVEKLAEHGLKTHAWHAHQLPMYKALNQTLQSLPTVRNVDQKIWRNFRCPVLNAYARNFFADDDAKTSDVIKVQLCRWSEHLFQRIV